MSKNLHTHVLPHWNYSCDINNLVDKNNFTQDFIIINMQNNLIAIISKCYLMKCSKEISEILISCKQKNHASVYQHLQSKNNHWRVQTSKSISIKWKMILWMQTEKHELPSASEKMYHLFCTHQNTRRNFSAQSI